jgi:very-short-patch-repair endonuclease
MRRKRSFGKNESPLEEQFAKAWEQHFPNLPKPVRQFPILNPNTNCHWKIDFSWPDHLVLVEIQGWGRHTRLAGQAKDYERQNYLTSLGWRCLFFNAINLKDLEESVTITAMVLCNAK